MNEPALRRDFEKLVTDIADKVIKVSSVDQISSVEKNAVQSIESMSKVASDGFKNQVNIIKQAGDHLIQQHERLSKEILTEIEKKYINRVKEAENSLYLVKESIDKFRNESDKLSELSVGLQQYEDLVIEINEQEKELKRMVIDYNIEVSKKIDKMSSQNNNNSSSLKSSIDDQFSIVTKDVGMGINRLEKILQDSTSKLVSTVNFSTSTINREAKIRHDELETQQSNSTDKIYNTVLTNSKNTQDEIVREIERVRKKLFDHIDQELNVFKQSQKVRLNWLIFLNVVLIGVTGTMLYINVIKDIL